MKKPSIVTEAIILNQYDYGERDQIFVMLTEQMGKISAFARSSRNSQKRFGGKLDLFCYGQFQLTSPDKMQGGLWKLEGGENVFHFLGFRSHLRAMTLASYLVECLDQFLAQEDPQPLLYRWLREKMMWLNTADQIHPSDGIVLETELLQLCGYRPSWNRCCECESALFQSQVYFSYELGGVTCKLCPKRGQGRWISLDAQGAASLNDLSRTLGDFVHHILGKPLRTRELKDEVIYG